MEILAAPPLRTQRAGSLLVSAYTPPEELTRVVEHAYHGRACNGWRLVDPCAGASDVHGFSTEGNGATFTGNPFEVQTEDVCSAMGVRDDREQRARDRLAQVESAAIAHEFWTGDLATAAVGAGQAQYDDNARLQADPDVTDLNPAGAVSPLAGLAMLEKAIGDMIAGAPGAIHGTREAVTWMAQLGDLRREADLILTTFDTRVIGDAGYPGSGPDGADASAGESWIYGTALPTVLRGPINVIERTPAEALDRTVNTLTYHAERPALVLLECGVVAVRITLAT